MSTNTTNYLSEHGDWIGGSSTASAHEEIGQHVELNPTASVSRLSAVALTGLLVSLATFLYAWSLPAAPAKPIFATSSDSVPTAIEEIQLGWRVVGENPLGQETWDEEPNADSWRKVVLNLCSEDGALIEISYLRPNAWFEKWRAEVGRTIDLSLSEAGKSGIAEVVAIEPCPEIRPGAGPVVTGLYRHLCKAGELVRVHFDENIDPIVGTYNHPFWSETRGDFVNAADLEPGERLLCTDDQIILVKSVEAVKGIKPVFNLETHNHHVYAVGLEGMIVHNTHGNNLTPKQKRATAAARLKARKQKQIAKNETTKTKLRKQRGDLEFPNANDRNDPGSLFLEAPQPGQGGESFDQLRRDAIDDTIRVIDQEINDLNKDIEVLGSIIDDGIDDFIK